MFSESEGYERFMLRQLFEPWAAELLSRADLHPGWSVLDVASGPGPVARLAGIRLRQQLAARIAYL